MLDPSSFDKIIVLVETHFDIWGTAIRPNIPGVRKVVQKIWLAEISIFVGEPHCNREIFAHATHWQILCVRIGVPYSLQSTSFTANILSPAFRRIWCTSDFLFSSNANVLNANSLWAPCWFLQQKLVCWLVKCRSERFAKVMTKIWTVEEKDFIKNFR